MIFNMSGGGGSDLNFSVVGSPTQPVAPKYNDIWVKTSVKIPDWEFSEVNMPSHAMSEGFVYFTSTYNGAWAARESTGLNFLRKHAILTKLTAACQYYSGAWHSMDAYIYKSGTWVQFSKLFYDLYNPGDDGSLFVVEKPATTYVAMISTVFGADGISCKKNDSGTKGVVIRTKAPVDITNERGTLKMRAKVINLVTSGDVYLKFGLGVNESNNVANAGGPNPSIGYHTYSLDLHNFAGTHNTIYIQLDSYDKSTVEVLIEELWLE